MQLSQRAVDWWNDSIGTIAEWAFEDGPNTEVGTGGIRTRYHGDVYDSAWKKRMETE